MSDHYPLDDDAESQLTSTSIRVSQSLYRDIEFIAKLWNKFDAERGLKRRAKWKPSSVMERLLRVGCAAFAAEVGGIPDSDAEREEFIRRAKSKVAELAAKSGKKLSGE